jgi:hypothetical protein
MPTAAERLELNRTLDKLAGRSYAEIAEHLTQALGRRVTRNTVRYYLSLTRNDANLPKGRPKGTVRRKDVWDHLIPMLLALTGLAASRLYRELDALLEPDGLPFRESAFHERTGHQKRYQSATPGVKGATGSNEVSIEATDGTKKTTSGKKTTSLLKRCRLRVAVVEVKSGTGRRKRVYLFGYEEVTGYVSFDIVANSQPGVETIATFVKSIEQHLALPVRRVCTVNIELPTGALAIHLDDTEVERWEGQLEPTPLPSQLKRKAELDLLSRLAKKQNDSVARMQAMEAKFAIGEFVRNEQNAGKGLVWPVVDLRRRQLAETLKPFLRVRFKLRIPSRRPGP